METGIIVALIAACASVVGGLVSGTFSILLHKAKHKDERQDKMEDERNTWEQHVDECLDADKRAIRRLEKATEDNKEMDKLMLRGLMLLTRHAVDHNGNNDLEAYANEVNDVLIQRL